MAPPSLGRKEKRERLLPARTYTNVPTGGAPSASGPILRSCVSRRVRGRSGVATFEARRGGPFRGWEVLITAVVAAEKGR